MRKEFKISKVELKNLYETKELSINQISKQLKCSYWYIWKSMKSLGINTRSLSEANALNNLKRKIIIPKEKLENLYLNKKLSILKIAKIYNCRHSVILNRLKENNIKRRNAIESNTKYHKNNFNGTQEDKAYMLGFVLGDLNVRRINKNGETIVVQGCSPIPEQIKLIKDLFKKYGKVQVRDFNGGFVKEKRATVNLNKSFDFLLYKEDSIPDWARLGRETFFAFFAGYIDAEGHIRTKIRTFLLINSYDKGILNQTYENLVRFGLNCPKPRISARKGYTSFKKKKPYKKDMWCLGIYSKRTLLNLYTEIKPYLKHKNKIKAMLKSIEQIDYRNRKYGNQRMK